jgi:hypothetical protein
MSILDTIMNFIYQIICFFYDKLDICKLITVSEETISSAETTSPESSQICPQDTCSYDQSREYNIPYSSQLNLNSGCDDIKDYIISELEKRDSRAFGLSRGDLITLTSARKRELIFVLENSSSLIEDENGNLSSGIRFKFCCPTEQNCLL